MADFPESLAGTKLVYLLPFSKSAKQAPQDSLVYPLVGETYVLTFSAPRGTNDSTPSGAKVPDQVITATFFEYVEKYITICRVEQGGILSGPFSGCWFVRFFTAGAYHAAHIGTTANQTDSRTVKRAFVDYADKSELSLISCFNANHAWSDDEKLQLIAGHRGFYNLGYIDNDGHGYSIFLVRDESKTFMTRANVVDHFPKRPDLTKIPELAKKPMSWAPLDVDKVDKSKRDLLVGHGYTVAGVRKLASRTWADVRTELLK